MKAAERREKDKVEEVLLSMLCTPKSVKGLIAAISGSGKGGMFVNGWVSAKLFDGALVRVKVGKSTMLQRAEYAEDVPAKKSQYPSWLECQDLPRDTGRTVVLSGEVVRTYTKEWT